MISSSANVNQSYFHIEYAFDACLNELFGGISVTCTNIFALQMFHLRMKGILGCMSHVVNLELIQSLNNEFRTILKV
jgi:hypothetical protein